MMQEVGLENPGNSVAPWGIMLVADIERKNGWVAAKDFISGSYNKPIKEYIEKLRDDINFYNTHGYADDKSKLLPNIRRLAAPIYDSDGNIIAALGAGSFTGMLNENQFYNLANALQTQSKYIMEKCNGI
jgi:hypothetical protein